MPSQNIEVLSDFFCSKYFHFYVRDSNERNREKIYDFNPCPPYPARHKGRNNKSIMKVSLKYLFEILKYFSVVDLNQLFGIAKENLMNFLTS